MCEGGSKFDAKDFHRNIIVATLHEKTCVEYIKRGGRNLRDEDDVLDLLEEIQDGIDAEMQLKHANRHRSNNNFKNNDDTNTRNINGHNKNMCRKKDHNHEWSKCPNNPNSKNYKGGDNRQRGDKQSRDGSWDDGGRRERHRHHK